MYPISAEDEAKADVPSKEFDIKTPTELASRIKSAKPGDVLVLPAGTLKDWTVDVRTSGTKDAPITIKGQGRDKTILTGKSAIRINGSSYVHLKDFTFSDNAGTAVDFRSTRHCSVIHASFTRIKAQAIIKIEGNGRNNQIASCHFSKNPSKNIVISIDGPKAPVETVIRDNLFEDVPPLGGND